MKKTVSLIWQWLAKHKSEIGISAAITVVLHLIIELAVIVGVVALVA